MKFPSIKPKKLNARGFSHDIVIVLFVVIFAIGGVAYLVGSHADAQTYEDVGSFCTKQGTAIVTKAGDTNTYKAPYYQNLSQGDSGDCVRSLQTCLNTLDSISPKLSVDGVFGPLTQTAVNQLKSTISNSAKNWLIDGQPIQTGNIAGKAVWAMLQVLPTSGCTKNVVTVAPPPPATATKSSKPTPQTQTQQKTPTQQQTKPLLSCTINGLSTTGLMAGDKITPTVTIANTGSAASSSTPAIGYSYNNNSKTGLAGVSAIAPAHSTTVQLGAYTLPQNGTVKLSVVGTGVSCSATLTVATAATCNVDVAFQRNKTPSDPTVHINNRGNTVIKPGVKVTASIKNQSHTFALGSIQPGAGVDIHLNKYTQYFTNINKDWGKNTQIKYSAAVSNPSASCWAATNKKAPESKAVTTSGSTTTSGDSTISSGSTGGTGSTTTGGGSTSCPKGEHMVDGGCELNSKKSVVKKLPFYVIFERLNALKRSLISHA